MPLLSYPRRLLPLAALLFSGLLPLHAAPPAPRFVTQNTADQFALLAGTIDTSAASVNVQVNGATAKGAGYGSANIGATTFTPASPNLTDTGPGTLVTDPATLSQPFTDINQVYADLDDLAPDAPFVEITTGDSTDLSSVNPAGLGNGNFPPGFYYVNGDATIPDGATIQFVQDPAKGPGDIVFLVQGNLTAGASGGVGANANAVAPEAPPNVLFVLAEDASLYDHTAFDGKLNTGGANLFDGVHVRGKVEADSFGTIAFTSPVGGAGIKITDWGSPPVGPNAPVPIPGLESPGIINSQQDSRNGSPQSLRVNGSGAYILFPGDTLSWQVDALDPDDPNLEVALSESGGPPDFQSVASGGTVTPPALAESYTPASGDEGKTFTVTYTAMKPSTGAVSKESISFFIDTPPAFVAPTPANGATVRICPDMANDVSLQASDGNAADSVSLSLTGVAAEDGGALPSNTFTQTAGNPATGTFQITPSSATDQGRAFDVTAAASNQNGRTVSETFTLKVDNLPVFTGSTPADLTVLTVPVGQALQYDIQATDPDGDPMHLEVSGSTIMGSAPVTAAGIPVGVVHTPNEDGSSTTTGTYGADSLIGTITPPENPVASQFSWTPTAADPGTYKLSYFAYDVICPGSPVETSVIVQVSTQPAFTYGLAGTPANGATIAVLPGQTASYAVQATSPDAGSFGELTLSSSASPGIPAGLYSETPSLPETAANSVATNVAFSPTLAQAGQSYTETYTVENGAGLMATTTVTLEVETPPVVTMVATTPNASNAPVTPGVFTVSRSGSMSSAVAVSYTVSGTAVPGADYTALSGNVILPAGQASATVTVTPLSGATASVPPTVILTLAAGVSYSLGSPATGTVRITEPAPSVTVVATTPGASSSPVTPGVFTVSRTGNTSSALTVSYNVSGTAVPGTDYAALSGSVTIGVGQASASVTVTPLVGASGSVPPTVILTLAAGAGYTPGSPAAATVSITEPAAVATVAATTPGASSSPVTPGIFTVSRTGNTSSALTVSYSVGGTAVPGADYAALSGTTTIGAGQTSASVTVTPLVGASASVPPTVVLTLTAGAGYTPGAPDAATVTITEPAPAVTVVATTATASNSPVTPGVFTVSRTGNTSSALTVGYTVSGTAVPGTDYTALSGSAAIPVGQSAIAVTVTPLAGATAPVPPTVVLTLAAGAGYVPGSPNAATVSITEPATVVTVVATTPDASNSPVTPGVFTVSRTGNTSSALMVTYAPGGTAVPGTDYTPLNGTVTIPVGQATATVTVTPLAGATAVTAPTVVLTLAAGSGYVPGSPDTASVTITEPAPAVVTVAATTPHASNSPVTPGVFTVSRTGSTSAALPVSYSVSGTAAPGTDYTALSGSVTIPVGQASATVTVTPLAGATATTAPTVILTVATGTGYVPGSPSSATVTITEPAPILVTVVATTPGASKRPLKAGGFTVSRTGATSAALTVKYEMGGTTVSGRDYKALSGSLTIPKKKASATVTITPLAASTETGSQTAILTLAVGTGYKLGSPGSATVTINEGAPLPGKLSVTPTSLSFGTVLASAGAKQKAFTIKNTGKGSLTVQVGTPTAAAFTDNAPTGSFTLAPGGSLVVTVSYTPAKGVTAKGTLTVMGGSSTLKLALSGKGK